MELNDFEMKFVESIINVDSDERIHNFSLRYKIRKKKIIRDYERSLYSQKPARLLKPRYILMAIILAAVLTVCGFGIYKFFEGFRITDYDIYSLLYITGDVTQGPDTIEKKFYIDMDMSEYEMEVLNDIFFDYFLVYSKDDVSLSVVQTTYDGIGTVRLNTENCLVEPTPVTINDWQGFYFQTQHGGYFYMFNTGKYIISYTSNLPKEDIENIVKTTKFK